MPRFWLCLVALAGASAGEAPLTTGDTGPSPVVVATDVDACGRTQRRGGVLWPPAHHHRRTGLPRLHQRLWAERYCLRIAMPGTYAIKARYYGSHQRSVLGPATVFTGYGMPAERHQALTLRRDRPADEVAIGAITVGPAP